MRNLFLILILMLVGQGAALAAPDASDPSSTHAEAIRLVLVAQAEEIQRLDSDPEAQDTAVRSWSAVRPAGSSTPDKASTFIVTLSIDGQAIAAWYVNTLEGTVEPHAVTP